MDKLFLNGRIETLDSHQTVCRAIGVSGDRIAALGEEAELRQSAGPGVEIIDLNGGVLFPGFIDSHTHLMIYAYLLDGLDLAPLETSRIADIITAVRTPNVAKIGVGARAITRKPMTEVSADSTSAPPVPAPALRAASRRWPRPLASSRYRAVK